MLDPFLSIRPAISPEIRPNLIGILPERINLPIPSSLIALPNNAAKPSRPDDSGGPPDHFDFGSTISGQNIRRSVRWFQTMSVGWIELALTATRLSSAGS